jgi:hypothetical protein
VCRCRWQCPVDAAQYSVEWTQCALFHEPIIRTNAQRTRPILEQPD